MEYISSCEQDTYNLGKKFGEQARPGHIICLDGDLGAGKTVFTRGFAAGLGAEDMVCSPTFTIVHEYTTGRLPLYHFDVYRIEEPEEMYEIGYEEYFFGEGVCLIEWATLIGELIPPQALHINIKRDYTQGNDYRKITVDGDI